MKRTTRLFLGVGACAFGILTVAAILTTTARSRSFRFNPSTTESGIFYDSGQALGNSVSQAVALGDLDGAPGLDALVANNGANVVWLNDGSGIFTGNGQTLGNLDSEDLALGDIDGDTDLDVVVANADGFDQVWTNNGSGQFSAGQAFESAASQGVAVGNLDGNGGPDVFIANNGPNTVWLNSAGTLNDTLQSLGSAFSNDAALGDLDGDGDLDIFVANGVSGGQPDKVWINQGGNQGGTEGEFSDNGQDLGTAWSYAVALGDLDGDTDLDAFTASWFPPGNKVWLNDGSGNFTDSGQLLGSAASLGISLADVDGDGDLDAVVANNTPDGGQVWINQGGAQGGMEGDFSDSGQTLGANTTTYEVGLADLDGDLDPDVFAANFGPNRVWLNGSGGLPLAFFDVARETNPNGDDVFYWASGGDAMLPIMLDHPYTATLDVHARIESGGGVVTETIPYSAGIQVRFLNLVNPVPNPDETITLTLSVTEQGTPPGPGDVTDNLLLAFVDADQGLSGCILCYIDWLARFVGFDPGFWILHHLDLPEQRSSPQWAYYTAINGIYSPEMSSIVAAHPSVLWTGLETLEEWTPAVQALDDGTGDTVTVTAKMASDAGDLIDGFKANAGPSLQAFLQQEQDALDIPSLVGLNMDELWVEFQFRRPASALYVTVVLKD